VLDAAVSRASGRDEFTSLGSVLIVDDEAAIRESLQTLLEFEGYSVDVANDGTEGLARIAEHPFDLVLLDFAMPERNGIEILREIRERDSELPVIMITAYGTVENAVNAMHQLHPETVGQRKAFGRRSHGGRAPPRRRRSRPTQARAQTALQLREHHRQERAHVAHF
jgi:CheY-like chemotaxis protein